MATVWKQQPRRVAVVVTALVMVALGACSSGRSSESSADYAQPEPGIAREQPGAEADGGSGGEGAPAAGAEPNDASFAVENPSEGQPAGLFISTGAIKIEVEDVATAKPRVVAVAEAAGGALFAEETSYGRRSRSFITLKVPPAAFSTVLTEIAGIGELVTQTVSSEDVTEQVVDLEARITAT
jgi:hypothetical protein